MPGFWIDIEDALGNKVGAGPITSALNWQHSPVLDGAGTFSFTVPASDPQTVYLTSRCIVRCRAIRDGAVVDHGCGIVQEIERMVGAPTMLRVSGPDIMAELIGYTVHDLVICEQQWMDLSDPTYGLLGWVRVDDTGHPDPTCAIPLAHDGNDATSEAIYLQSRKVAYVQFGAYLYLGCDARFDAGRFKFLGGGRTADAGKVLYAQYYNGDGWQHIVVIDGTDDGSGTMRQDGDVTWTRPADWVRYNAIEAGGNWFWIRLKLERTAPDDPSYTGYLDLAEVQVYADVPTVTGPELIMDFAPGTWSISWAGDPTPVETVWEKYLEFSGQSVLEALVSLAEQGGVDTGTAIREHFRLGAGRVIEWLGTTQEATDIRAVSVRDPIGALGAPELMLITRGGLTEVEDSSEIVTRIYPYSGEGLSIALSDRTPPAGYTAGSVAVGDKTFYYIEHDAGVAAYGVVELEQRFDDLTMQQADSFTMHPVFLANAVFDRAVELLRAHAMASKHYELSVVQFPELLKPGQMVDVVYHEFTNAVHTVDIDTVASGTPLWILSPTLLISPEGVNTTALKVATIDRDAQTDAGVVVAMVRQSRRATGATGNISTLGSISSPSQPPTAGADIRTDGYRVQRAGAGVLLFSGSGALLVEYSSITAALADAAAGDWIDVPAGTWVESFTVAVGITLRGAGLGVTIISGAVLCYGTMIDLTVDYTAGSDDDLIPVRGGNNSLCIHVGMTGVQSGTGDIIPCVSIADSADTPMECYDCVMRVEASGGGSAWWPGEVVDGGLRIHHGSLITEMT